MADHEQTDTDESAATSDSSTTESDSIESTTVEETGGTSNEAGFSKYTFAGRNAVRTAGLVAGLGVLIFWGPVLLTSFGPSIWVQFGLGFAIALVGSLTALKGGEDTISAVGLPLLAAVFALVTMALPLLIDLGSDFSGPLALVNAILGAAVILFALLTIYGFRKDAAARPRSAPQAN